VSLEISQNRLDTPVDRELLIDVMKVRFYGIHRQAQLVRNFLVTLTGRSARQYFSFPIGQT
jgi:hypothetical protein